MRRIPRLVGIALGAAVLATLALLSSGPPAADAAFQDTDGDSFTDYLEVMTGSAPGLAASVPESLTSMIFGPGPPAACFDFIDNDLDGLFDGADLGCANPDGDFADSMVELTTGSIPFLPFSTPEHTGFDGVAAFYGWPFFPTCFDLADNDFDGPPDGADPGCLPIDTDGDGLDDFSEKTIYFTSPTLPDTDGDTLTDGAEVLGMASPKAALGILFSDPLLVDGDGDGCSDPEEMGASALLGGRRDPMNPNDFYDVGGAGGIGSAFRDGTIDLFNDIFGVAFAYGDDADALPPAEPDGYDATLDRGPSYANAWNITGPDGLIDLFIDIFGVAYQYGHDCTAAP